MWAVNDDGRSNSISVGTHHIFIDGTGTITKGDMREYSTSSTRRD